MTTVPEVRALTSADESEWTAFVRGHDAATFYHTLAWRDFVAEVFGHRPRYLIAKDGNQIVGALPLFEVAFPWLGSKFISLPYDVGSGGALAGTDDVERHLAAHALSMARDRGARYLELRGGHRRPALEALGFRVQEPVVISDMALANEAEVRAGISTDHRKAIRKAASRGVRVRDAVTAADYETFYEVYLRVFRDFGTPPYAARYFASLFTSIQPEGGVRTFLAEVDGRCVGGLVLFCFERSLVSKFAVCLPDAVTTRAYAALYWRAIEFGLAGGYQRLSWGTSSRDQTGLIEFKERWGAISRDAVLYDMDVRGRAPDLASYYESGGVARSVWRRLPLAVTRGGGAVLNRWFC